MSKPKGWIIGQWAGAGMSVALAGIGAVALRHALETPQPLRSVLPGEAHLYRWQKRSIFYKVAGAPDAPPLVLLHRPDIGGSGHEMQAIMAPLAETYRVYTLDLLGFGISDRPGIEYSARMYSVLCKDFLREVVQRPAIVVASGLSCNYAVIAASEEPDLCSSLVLISPTNLQGEAQPSQVKLIAEKQPVKALLYPLLSTRLAFLLTNWWQRRTPRRDFVQFYANTHQLGAEHAVMALLAGKLTENAEQAFEALGQPVLMIWGTHALDNQAIVANLHRTATLLNPERRSRKVELIQEACLAVHLEQPGSVINALNRWLEETVPQALQEAPAAATVQVVDRAVATTSERSGDSVLSSETASETASLDVVEEPEREEEEQAEIAASTVEQQTQTPASNEAKIVAYCVKCKQKRIMVQAQKVVMKNGRPAIRGICPICGTRLNRIGEVH